MGDGGVEIDIFVERVDFNGGLCVGGEGMFGMFVGCVEMV